MTTKPENPNAFPMPGLSGLPNGQFMHGDHGMSLRDYFAAAALQGLMGNMSLLAAIGRDGENLDAARHCYAMADAMLAARAA